MGNRIDKFNKLDKNRNKSEHKTGEFLDKPLPAVNARGISIRNASFYTRTIDEMMEKEFVKIIKTTNTYIKNRIKYGSLSLKYDYELSNKMNNLLNKIKNRTLKDNSLKKLCKRIDEYYEKFGYTTEVEYFKSSIVGILRDIYVYHLDIKIFWKTTPQELDEEVIEKDYRG